MTNRLLLCSLICFFCSCATLNSKQRLKKKGINSIGSKNYIENGKEYGFNVFSNPDMDLSTNALKRISKKQIRIRLRNVEHFYALLPDTTLVKGNQIDSFYSNPSKIKYIKEHNLVTSNMHFSK